MGEKLLCVLYMYHYSVYMVYIFIYQYIFICICMMEYIFHLLAFLCGDGWSPTSWYRDDLNRFVCQTGPFNKDVADPN